MIIQFLDP